MTELKSAGLSDVGLRDNNEDCFLVDEALQLYLVADGVGGHQAGEVASATAVEVVRRELRQWHEEGRKAANMSAAVSQAIEAACAEVHELARESSRRAGMGTTMTLLLVDGTRGVMGHVGDSRLYLVRDGRIEQVSTDHTLAAELYRGGLIPKEQVETHPHSHVLTRSLGSQSSVMVETLQLEVRPGDLYLLSSDGLNPASDDREELMRLVEEHKELPQLLAHLVARAKDQGSRDNITAVALRIAGDVEGLPPTTADMLRGIPILSRLTTADLNRVVAAMEARTYAAGQEVMKKDERVSELVLVVSGKLRWELQDGHFGELAPGTGIGQTTLVRARRCPGHLTAAEDTQILALSSAAFRRLTRRRERLGVALLTALAEELSDWIDPDSDRGVASPPHGLLIEF